MNKKTESFGPGITHLIHHDYDQPVSNAKPEKCVFHNGWFLKCSKVQESKHTFILLHNVQEYKRAAALQLSQSPNLLLSTLELLRCFA